ncbi:MULTISPECIES: hypothetical protein [unclassified Plantibacter]|jgi:hypothetical protein|uniref:hypothetical protein n=1 Tax=unclassified Plantibacter TaxID=2624265 RepID=UPI003D34CE69
MSKTFRWILIIAVGVTAYVLGAKAGRERYREIRQVALSAWNDPQVKKIRKRAVKEGKKATKAATKQAEQFAKRHR